MLIAYLNRDDAHHRPAVTMLVDAATGDVELAANLVTVAEVLVAPTRQGREDQAMAALSRWVKEAPFPPMLESVGPVAVYRPENARLLCAADRRGPGRRPWRRSTSDSWPQPPGSGSRCKRRRHPRRKPTLGDGPLASSEAETPRRQARPLTHSSICPVASNWLACGGWRGKERARAMS